MIKYTYGWSSIHKHIYSKIYTPPDLDNAEAVASGHP